MDGPAYVDSILRRKVAACVATARTLWHWNGLGLLDDGSDMTKWRAGLWRVRPLRLSGFVVVLLAGLKPRQAIAVADADKLWRELGDDRALAGFA